MISEKKDFEEKLKLISSSLKDKKWIFAKTMPKNPHYYTLRKDWKDENFTFDEIVLFIRKFGEKEKYQKSWYMVLNIDNKKYWTMGNPLEKTILINRKDLE